MSRLLRIGTMEFHVVVEPLLGGGFTYACVEVDRTGQRIEQIRFESSLRYESEEAAYAGGSAYARKQRRRVPQ